MPSEVVIAVDLNDEKREFREPVPDGFPSGLVPHLVDFWRRGFAARVERHAQAGGQIEGVDLRELAAPASGRPISTDVQKRGKKAAALIAKGLTYGQIATQLCPERADRFHRCGKKCSDRLRQEMLQYEHQQYLKDLQKGD